MKVPAASPSRDPHHPPAPRITSRSDHKLSYVIVKAQAKLPASELGPISIKPPYTALHQGPRLYVITIMITISSYNRVRNSTTLTDSPNSEESVLRAIIAAFARSVSLFRRRLSTRQVSTPHQPPSPIPRPHPSISNSRDISARGAHSCALVRSLSLSIACDSTHHSNPAEHPLSSSWPSSPCMSRHVGAGPPATPPGIVMAASTRCSPLRAPACPWS